MEDELILDELEQELKELEAQREAELEAQREAELEAQREAELKELEAQREAERIANELEAQALLPIIEAERARPTETERLAVLESAVLDIIMGGLS